MSLSYREAGRRRSDSVLSPASRLSTRISDSWMLFTGTVSLPIVIATRVLIGYPQVAWQFHAFWFAALSISMSHSRIVAPSRFCDQFVLQSVPSIYACACRDVVAICTTVSRHGDAAVRYAGRPAARGTGRRPTFIRLGCICRHGALLYAFPDEDGCD